MEVGGADGIVPDDIDEVGPDTARTIYERYTGVCDVISPEEALAMANELREHRKDPGRKVMIGVMTHPLALDPTIPVPSEVRRAITETLPAREQIAEGFISDPDVLNTIHYADLYGPDGPWEAHASPNLLKNLELCVAYGGENLHAIQLDVTWPNVDDIDTFKAAHPEVKIILQLGKFAFQAADNDPQKVVDMLDMYGDSIDYVLVDMSMGKGKSMDSEGLLPILRLIQRELPGLGLAVAGGLGPDSMDPLKPIADEFPGISIDAQGRLKPAGTPTDSMGHIVATVPADLGRSRDYIQQSCTMLDNPKKEPQLAVDSL